MWELHCLFVLNSLDNVLKSAHWGKNSASAESTKKKTKEKKAPNLNRSLASLHFYWFSPTKFTAEWCGVAC